MSYNATGNSASRRIATLLDEGSFVEIGGAVTARSTDFNMQEKEAPSDGVITGYGVIDCNLVYVVRMLMFSAELSERCMRKRSHGSMIWQ